MTDNQEVNPGEALTPQKQEIVKHVLRLRELKDMKDDLEEQLKAVNNEARRIQENILPKMLSDQEIEKMKVKGAGTIYVKDTLYVSMAKDEQGHEAPFYAWARENAPDLIVPYIHPARLKSWAGEMLEAGKPIPSNTLKAVFVPTATLLRK